MNRQIHRSSDGLIATYVSPQRWAVRSGSPQQLYAAQYQERVAALQAAEAELPALQVAEQAAKETRDQASTQRARLSAAITRVEADLKDAKQQLGRQAADAIRDGK